MLNVLIVDDNKNSCECLLQRLPWADMDCNLPIIAHNGLVAWKILQQEQIDFLICDVKMPKMDGTELAAMIHSNGLPVKMVFLSAYEDFSAARKALKYGVTDYILKPIDTESLTNLENFIRGVSSPAENTSSVYLPKTEETETEYTVRRIKELVEKNFYRPECNVSWIADSMQMSSAYVGRAFNKMMGIGLSDYIMERRIKEAVRLLDSDIASVTMIAERIGYTDANYFARVFRNKMGMSPSEYRRNKKEK